LLVWHQVETRYFATPAEFHDWPAKNHAGRSGVYSYENRHLAALDAEREAMFKARKVAWAFFGKQPPSYRQTAIYWVMNAKRDETRSKRLAKLIALSAARRRIL
jgi:uncharacterized protein YdeI (YjbR/CyaY-like superfamily)